MPCPEPVSATARAVRRKLRKPTHDPPNSVTAYLDESLRQGPDGFYLVAAVVLAQNTDEARNAVKDLLLRRQQRFHWRDETEAQRLRMLDRIAELGLPLFSYRCPILPRSERSRALCLNRLLWDLLDHDIDELVLESRGDANDQHDRQTVVTAQKAGRAPQDLVYRHERPEKEPLLWLPDAVAGAVASSLYDSASRYLKPLRDQLSITEVRP